MSYLPSRRAAGTTALLLPFFLATADAAQAASHRLASPDGRIEVRIEAADRLRYAVSFKGTLLLEEGRLSLDVDHAVLGPAARLKSAKPTSVDATIAPVVRQKAASLRERYHQLRLEFEGGYAVVFRAYDEGVAYRWETSLPRAEVKVYREEVGLRFAGDWDVYYPQEESFFSHNERDFLHRSLKDLAPQALASVPAVVEAADGVKIAIADADVDDYPGLWLQGTSGPGLEATFPPYPLEEKLPEEGKRDRDLRITRAADYIAVTRGARTYPWRVLGIAERDGDLITNPLVYLLARPTTLTDTAWIRPGKVAWDWWNANNVYGVGFKSGVNTATYEYFIDFAARYGIEYVILDEGWYTLGNVLEVAPGMDMEKLTAYARQKGVGLVLWVVWKSLDDQLQPALDRFEKWGIKGIKVDFMQRDDQPVINFYHRVCREAAKRRMLVDYHGAIRPATMTRTWPNLISTEGVLGLEQLKWSTKANPQHNVTIPFTRMFLGPMDYTPGAMVNGARKAFAPIFEQPMSLGTRGHELAKYVVFESPLQMLADSPSNYLREPEAMEFLAPVPTTWDETRVLAAKLGAFVAVARRRGREWWVGAMTDWTARDLELDLSFLPEGRFALDGFEDGANADRHGSDYVRVKSPVDRTTRLKVRLAEGGGYAARLVPED